MNKLRQTGLFGPHLQTQTLNIVEVGSREDEECRCQDSNQPPIKKSRCNQQPQTDH